MSRSAAVGFRTGEPREVLTGGGVRVPLLELPAPGGGRTIPVPTPQRTSSILVFVHPHSCPACQGYLSALGQAMEEISEWGGQLTVIYSDDPAEDALRIGAYPLVSAVDVERRLRARLSVSEPAVVIADEWREVHLAHEATADHRFPVPNELIEWSRYLATRCPECEGEAL